MRKLTVKNFSVIKEAELEFGKITVLIGPQSTGKSLLCKLAYFLGREVLDIAVARVVNRFDFAVFELAVREEFARWFPSGGWGNGDWRIEFQSSDYRVVVKMPSKLMKSARRARIWALGYYAQSFQEQAPKSIVTEMFFAREAQFL